MKTFSDTQLIFMILQGEKDCFDHLVDRYWPMAVAMSLSRVSDMTTAEDIAQESFIQAYRHLRTLQNPDRFAGWLTQIIRKKCIDYYRRASKTRPVSLSAVDISQVPAYTSNPGLTDGQIKLVRESISKMPERYRRVILMRFMAGLSTQEISRQLNRKYGTISVWFHRAYNMLRQELAPLFTEGQSHDM